MAQRSEYIVGTPEERFWPKIDASGDCWIWTAAINDAGYGIFRVDGRNVRAHRWAWEFLIGPIPEGLTIDHRCRVTACVNPDHLEIVTHKVNAERSIPGGRIWRRLRSHCKNGHPFAEHERWFRNQRYCKECRRISQKKLRDRKRRAN